MPDTDTTLNEFADHASIRRTVNEYATSYEVPVPEDVFDIGSFSGYLKYDLISRDDGPALRVTLNPQVEEYGENVLLVTGEDALPLPRGLIESCAPESLTDWQSENGTITARLDIPLASNLPGDRLARGTQSITVHDDEATLTLPKHPDIAEKPACSLQVAHGPNGFELAVTLMPPGAAMTPIEEATTLPSTRVPVALARALGEELFSVTVFDGGPITTRGALLDKYGTALGLTERGAVPTEAPGAIPLPEGARQALDTANIDGGLLRVVPDEDALLLVFDGNQADGDREFEFDSEAGRLSCDDEFARWLNLPEADLYWHFHDGTLIGEAIATRPSATTGTRGFIGGFDDRTATVPTVALSEAGVSLDGTGGLVATLEDDRAGFAIVEEGGTPVSMTPGDEVTDIDLPDASYDALAIEEDDALLCLPARDGLVCLPMDENEARRRAGVASPEEMEDTRMHIPEDGHDAFVQQVGEGDPAVGIPREATEQFDLEEGSKFAIRLGTYNGTLSLYCEPIENEDVDADVCLGRMLSQSNLRLPIQLVSTLSLFERSITWGLLWEADGPRLVGLIEGMQTPPLSEGMDVGTGQVYTTVKNRDDGSPGATHYATTIPREAFDVYSEHPPGVFVACEAIDGVSRLVLMPVGEADLEIIGAVKLRDHWDDYYYEVTLPKSLAAAFGVSDEDEVSWTFLDGQFVGTLSSANQF